MRQISMMSLSVTSLPVCIMKTSCPRTDSSYRTYCSPQENVWSSTPPSSMPNSFATFSARARWEDPEKSFIDGTKVVEVVGVVKVLEVVRMGYEKQEA